MKAFDCLKRSTIWRKLSDRLSKDDIMISKLKNLQSKTYLTLKFPWGNGERILTNTGILQGSCLSPLLWNLMMENMMLKINEMCDCFIYLDDLVIVSHDHKVINKALYCVVNELKAMGLVLDKDKCKYICFGGKNHKN